MTPSESHTLTPSMRSRILDMWDSGTDTYDIAKAIGYHESEVYNALSKMSGETLPAPDKRRRSA